MNKRNIIGIISTIVIICIVVSAFIIVNDNRKVKIEDSEIEVTNKDERDPKEEKPGIIGILTTDAKTGEGIEGVKYKLFDSDMDEVIIYNSEKEAQETLVSNSKGQAAVKNLKLGKYFYQEVYAPEPYTVNDTVYEVILTKEDPKVIKKVKK